MRVTNCPPQKRDRPGLQLDEEISGNKYRSLLLFNQPRYVNIILEILSKLIVESTYMNSILEILSKVNYQSSLFNQPDRN